MFNNLSLIFSKYHSTWSVMFKVVSLTVHLRCKWVNPLMLTTAKNSLQYQWYNSGEDIFRKIFEGEMLITTILNNFPLKLLRYNSTFTNHHKEYHIPKRRFLQELKTISMLRLLSSKAQGRKDFWKPSKKPCHVGIHWKVLNEYYQMSTHVQGFRSFLSFLLSFHLYWSS